MCVLCVYVCVWKKERESEMPVDILENIGLKPHHSNYGIAVSVASRNFMEGCWPASFKSVSFRNALPTNKVKEPNLPYIFPLREKRCFHIFLIVEGKSKLSRPK